MSYGAAGFTEYGIPSSASTSAVVAQRAGGGRTATVAARRATPAADEYAWEKAYEHTWEAIEEDEETGALITRGLERRRAG
jgi:hypothetical protein